MAVTVEQTERRDAAAAQRREDIRATQLADDRAARVEARERRQDEQLAAARAARPAPSDSGRGRFVDTFA